MNLYRGNNPEIKVFAVILGISADCVISGGCITLSRTTLFSQDNSFKQNLSASCKRLRDNGVPPMLDEALEHLENRIKDIPNYKYEIIVVSDGSKDKTVKVAETYTAKYGSEKVRCLELVKNRGKGGAVRLGVQRSRGALILFADADGATKFEDLTKLEVALKELVKFDASSLPVRASDCHAIVIGAFDVELLYIAQTLNIPIAEVPVRWTEIEGSKVTPVISWIQMGCDLGLIWLKYKLGAWKIKTDKSE
ncbi:hypothetical protein MSG28_001784 [Choristoneura fumiferana]|uniref:Uncharacterized protein n=1 Tax=Choristoneura fumiferana TaxID=7141 RepID=A0ACC0KWI2_CHOFU|nr:hypothetical protein MSG28_001784 [Choristoneura fumiferana]